MFESIVVYGLLTIVMVLCGIVAAQREHLYYHRWTNCNNYNYKLSFLHWETIFPLIVFAFIFGCRYNVGVDYPAYLKMYIWGGDREMEPLFLWVTDSMSDLNIHYACYFGLWAFIQVFLLFYTLRHQRFLFPFMAFFLIFGSYYLSMMNIIRQQVAACIFLYSIQYIDNKKFVKYFLCIFFASLFHKSAWLVIILYPLFQWRKDWFPNIKIQIIFYLIALYLSFNYDFVINLISGIFSDFARLFGYDVYLIGILRNEQLDSMAQFGNNTGYGFYINVFISVIIILFSNRLKNYYKNNFFLMIYSMWFIRILADFVIGASIILNRPFVYFTNIKIIMLAYFIYYCVNSKRVIPQLLIVGFILIHVALFVNMLSNGEINTSMYRFFWEQ